MLLYHFTAWEYLPSIARHGLWKGEVPISISERRNAVNLTSLATADGHGLEIFNSDGIGYNSLKKAIRLAVEVDPISEPLEAWSEFAPVHVSKKMRRRLEDGRRPETWYFYRGILLPERLSCFDMEARRSFELAAFVDAPSSYNSPPPSVNSEELWTLDLASADWRSVLR